MTAPITRKVNNIEPASAASSSTAIRRVIDAVNNLKIESPPALPPLNPYNVMVLISQINKESYTLSELVIEKRRLERAFAGIEFNFEGRSLFLDKLSLGQILAKFCPSLKELTVTREELRKYKVDLMTFFSDLGISSLETLDITGCNVSDAMLKMVAKSCRGLKTLSFAECPQVTKVGLEWIGKGCVRLNRLDISHTRLDSQALKLFASHSRITEFVYKGCVVEIGEGLNAISERGLLRVVDLSDSAVVHDAWVASVIARSPQLEILFVTGDEALTDQAIRGFAVLRKLDISYCPKITGSAFKEFQCPTLMELGVNGCVNMQREHLESLFAHTRALTTLSLSEVPILPNMGPLLSLRKVDMSGKRVLPVEFLLRISRQLTTLIISQGVILKPDLIELVKRAYALEMLDLSYVDVVDNEVLQNLLQAAQGIKSLNLEGLNSLDGASLALIGNGLKDLRDLSLRGLQKISFNGIKEILKRCTELKYLDLGNTPLIKHKLFIETMWPDVTFVT